MLSSFSTTLQPTAPSPYGSLATITTIHLPRFARRGGDNILSNHHHAPSPYGSLAFYSFHHPPPPPMMNNNLQLLRLTARS
mmetsp:Transcript_9930/g.16851  ORF Transcript_9930/g.16851 Transcript_9930/m.16851 type:complete len:81 (-) Transcript_9930:17-259(-)